MCVSDRNEGKLSFCGILTTAVSAKDTKRLTIYISGVDPKKITHMCAYARDEIPAMSLFFFANNIGKGFSASVQHA